MAVFRYTGVVKDREDVTESGKVVARSEDEARKKLTVMRFKKVHLQRLGGLSSFIGKFSADIR